MNLTLGKVLQNGKYKIERVLGVGSWGITYRAQTYEGQDVVIKTINKNFQNHPGVRGIQEKMFQASQQLTECRHPHLVKILDSFVEKGQFYWVMEYIFGQTLTEIVEAGEPISDRQATDYIRQIASGLQALHERGLLHGNINPGNIMRLLGTHQLILMDVGLTYALTPETSLHPQHFSTNYSAIEQYLVGQYTTPATDVYGLATTFYYLLTGQVPLSAPLRIRQTTPQLIYLGLPDVSQFRPQVNPHLVQGILPGVEVNPQLRPQSVTQWLELLPVYVIPSDSKESSPNYTNRGGNVMKMEGKNAQSPLRNFPKTSSPQPLPKIPLFFLFIVTAGIFGWIGFDIAEQLIKNNPHQIVSHRGSLSQEELFEQWLDQEREKPGFHSLFDNPSVPSPEPDPEPISEESPERGEEENVVTSSSSPMETPELSRPSPQPKTLIKVEEKQEETIPIPPPEQPLENLPIHTPSVSSLSEPLPSTLTPVPLPQESVKTDPPPSSEIIPSPAPSPSEVEVPTLPELSQTDSPLPAQSEPEYPQTGSESTPDLKFPPVIDSTDPLLN